jgi:hypothetical protein
MPSTTVSHSRQILFCLPCVGDGLNKKEVESALGKRVEEA